MHSELLTIRRKKERAAKLAKACFGQGVVYLFYLDLTAKYYMLENLYFSKAFGSR